MVEYLLLVAMFCVALLASASRLGAEAQGTFNTMGEGIAGANITAQPSAH